MMIVKAEAGELGNAELFTENARGVIVLKHPIFEARFDAANAIGQVFAVTLDDGAGTAAPNVYAASTSAYGLQIVGAPGADVHAGGDPAQGRPGEAGHVRRHGSGVSLTRATS